MTEDEEREAHHRFWETLLHGKPKPQPKDGES
jgi:hypothetical protein